MTEHSWHFSDWEAALGVSTEIALDDDAKGGDELKMSTRLCKTADEIERFSVDEKLSETEQALFLLKNGAPVQKLCVISTLRRLLLENDTETKNVIIPELLNALAGESVEVQSSSGRAISDLLQEGLLTSKLALAILPHAQKMVDGGKQPVVDAWADVIISSIRHLPLSTIENEILPAALVDGSLAQPANHRIWSCRVLGAVAGRMDAPKIQQTFYRKALTLCQDTDYEVRVCMCNQLNAIARVVKPTVAKRELIDEYLELLSDEEQMVREAALTNIVQLLAIVDGDVKSTIIVPLWRKLCSEKSQPMMLLIGKELGKFLWETKAVMTDAELSFFMSIYHSLGTSNNAEARSMCAYNFPAIVKNVGAEHYEHRGLNLLFDKLSQDTCIDVRRRLACGMHEVAALLGKMSFHYLKAPFLRLLSDAAPEVYECTFRTLDRVLVYFISDEVSHKNNQLDEILFVLIRREKELAAANRSNWRSHHALLQQFRNLPNYFSTDMIHDHCIPLFMKLMMQDRVMPIKSTATTIVCVHTRKLRRLEQREKVIRQLIQELTTSRNYKTRLLYLDVCQNMLDIASQKFFRENFLSEYLNFAKDPVPNVRLRMCKMLPQVKKTLRMPLDSGLMQKLNDAVGTLLTDDADRDVTLAANDVVESINNCGSSIWMNGSMNSATLTTDNSDKMKECEESEGLVVGDDECEDYGKRDSEETRHEMNRRKELGKDRHVPLKPGKKIVVTASTAMAKRNSTSVVPSASSLSAGSLTAKTSGHPSTTAATTGFTKGGYRNLPTSPSSSASSLSPSGPAVPTAKRGKSAGTGSATQQKNSKINEPFKAGSDTAKHGRWSVSGGAAISLAVPPTTSGVIGGGRSRSEQSTSRQNISSGSYRLTSATSGPLATTTGTPKVVGGATSTAFPKVRPPVRNVPSQ